MTKPIWSSVLLIKIDKTVPMEKSIIYDEGPSPQSVDFWVRSYNRKIKLQVRDFLFIWKVRLDPLFFPVSISHSYFFLVFFPCIFFSLPVPISGVTLLLLLYPFFSTPRFFSLGKLPNPLLPLLKNHLNHPYMLFWCWEVYGGLSYMWRWKGILKIVRKCQDQEKPGEFEFPLSVPFEKLFCVLPDLHRSEQMQSCWND